MKIKLKSGKEVYVEAFHCTPTYAGMLLGSPSKESNEILINSLSYPKEWGTKVCVIKKSDMFTSENRLKAVINSVWLSSEPILDKENKFDTSELIIIWFVDEQLDKTIQELIVDGIGNIEYEKYSENFNF